LVLLQRPLVAEPGQDGTAARNPEQATMRTKPFTVYQPVPGQNPKPLFTVHAYSLEQARALVTAKVAGETIVVGPVKDGAGR
jgi:hypothetical protein